MRDSDTDFSSLVWIRPVSSLGDCRHVQLTGFLNAASTECDKKFPPLIEKAYEAASADEISFEISWLRPLKGAAFVDPNYEKLSVPNIRENK